MKKRRAQTPKLTTSSSTPVTQSDQLPTFQEHLYELRRRLFWVVAVILAASSAAYPFLDKIIGILSAPLGRQQLYYLTPVGGLSFSIKLCMYVGVMVAVPVIMYHMYRFMEPLMGKWRRSAVFYVGLSSLFAIGGILFAYFFSLPGALHFLTGLNLNHIQAMLTVDSYLTFVMTYLLGAALLFQIPLLLLIVNTMTPLKPGKLMKLQRYVIVGAFLLAAVISPTPDIMNQIIFALPIIAMYEIGVVLVWLQNRNRARKKARTPQVFAVQAAAPPLQPQPAPRAQPLTTTMQQIHFTPAKQIHAQPHAQVTPRAPRMDIVAAPRPPASQSRTVTKLVQPALRAVQQPSMDGMVVNRTRPAPLRPPAPQPRQLRTAPVQPRPLQVPRRTIDGFTPYQSSFVNSP